MKNNAEIINRILSCETRTELDLMRLEIIQFISQANDVEVAQIVRAFIIQKNKLRRHGR